jgi:hypothetical protein
MLLAEALDYLESHSPPEAALSVFTGGELFDEIEGLDIDCAVLKLARRPGQKALTLTYTWDWLENHSVEERAARITEQLLAHAKGQEAPGAPDA